jgi:lysozyme
MLEKNKLDIEGVKLLEELEGLKLKAYKCSAGVWTIGIGNTFYEDGTKVKEGDSITKIQAYFLFNLISKKFVDSINDNVKVKINQNQFNSLFCFVYNVGISAFKNSTLLRILNVNPNDGNIAKQFLRWNKIAGKESKGLTNRRIKESSLYFTK